MNRIFKAIWDETRQTFVTTSELQKTHGKKSKSVALFVAAALTLGGG